MHIIEVSTTFLAQNIFVSAVQDLQAIFGPSFFNLKAIMFTIYEVKHRVGADADRNS